jgi:hypothetical protein
MIAAGRTQCCDLVAAGCPRPDRASGSLPDGTAGLVCETHIHDLAVLAIAYATTASSLTGGDARKSNLGSQR